MVAGEVGENGLCAQKRVEQGAGNGKGFVTVHHLQMVENHVTDLPIKLGGVLELNV